MSIEAVNQFLTKVSEDKQLQAELAQAMEAEDDRQAATELAAKYGYEFTPEELWLEIEKRQNEFQNNQTNDELSEEELEAVAGGACFGGLRQAIKVGNAFPAVKKAAKW